MSSPEVLDLLMTDRLEEAARALEKESESDPILKSLIERASGREKPLASLTADLPEYVVVNPSYTCNIGCKMCITGFHNKTEIDPNYKYLSPEQFEKAKSWVRTGTHVFFVGIGETLDSPYLFDFLEDVDGPVKVVTTSGVPLTREKIRKMIETGVQILNFSFDGKTSVGHGDGKDTYIKNIWSKIDLVTQVKKEMHSESPVMGLNVTVNKENLDDLDNLFTKARERDIRDILLLPMSVVEDSGQISPMLYEKSFGPDFDRCSTEFKNLVDRWNKNGLRLQVNAYPEYHEKASVCSYVDNTIQIHGLSSGPNICCGKIEMPLTFWDTPPEEYWNSLPFRYFRYLHFVGERQGLPRECQDCWILETRRYYKTCGEALEADAPAIDPIPVYQEGSRFKRDGLWEQAETRLREVLALTDDDALKGGVYFHLTEIELARGNDGEALDRIQKCIQHNFDHKRGWAYLSLLMRITGLPKVEKRKDKFPLVYHPEIKPGGLLV